MNFKLDFHFWSCGDTIIYLYKYFTIRTMAALVGFYFTYLRSLEREGTNIEFEFNKFFGLNVTEYGTDLHQTKKKQILLFQNIKWIFAKYFWKALNSSPDKFVYRSEFLTHDKPSDGHI